MRGLLLLSVLCATAAPAGGQQRIALDADLPRVVVFLLEEGTTAARVLAAFLHEAGFQVIDPAFAEDTADRERAARALAGDEAEAVALGRDFGAQVIILGSASAEAAVNPVDASLRVGTAQLDVRALRLDEPRVIAYASASGRRADATPQAARLGAIRHASETLLRSTAFLGNISLDWDERRWNDGAYWRPHAPDAQASGRLGDAGPLAVAVLESEFVSERSADGTRGIAVVQRQEQAAAGRVRVRGLVSSLRAEVTVEGVRASVRPLSRAELMRLGLQGEAGLFEAESPFPTGRSTVRILARLDDASAEAITRPKLGSTWAVVIGIDTYRDSRIAPLRYAARDAQAFREFLRSPAGGSVDDSRIRLLLNEHATATALREALFVFLQQAAEDDLVIVYVASHGAPDPMRPSNLYILTHDAHIDALASTAFPMWDFKTALRRHIASERVAVFADACHAGGAATGEANPIGGAFADLFSPSRRLTLSASDADELSREGAQWGGGHGVFTYKLLAGLGGAADANGDGVVSFSELADYVARTVSEATGGTQNPQRAGLGDLPLGRPDGR